MILPELFRTYLLSKDLSGVTVKNYVSDIRRFIFWFEASFGKTFETRDLTPDVITLFESLRPYPNRSLERYLSSLRKFAAFLVEEGFIEKNPFTDPSSKIQAPRSKQDPWFLKDFKDYLYVFGASGLTIKNYFVDIKAFTNWLENIFKKDLNISDNYVGAVTAEIIEEYKKRLIYVLRLSPKTVNRKLSSIRKYLEFLVSRGYLAQELKTENLKLKTDSALKLEDIKEEPYEASSGVTSKIPPIRLFLRLLIPYSILEESIASKIAEFIKRKKISQKTSVKNVPVTLSWHKNLIHHLKYTRPEWYKRYHSYTFTHYFHLAILIVYGSAVGYILYNSLFLEPRQRTAMAGPIAPLRVLSFQGRLTDANDNPITSATDIRFAIYENETASSSALLWQEVQSAVTPDSDGIFSLLLGTKNGIQGGLFRDHDLLWLGITIGTTSELTPRQRLAAVAYAANSEALEGMLPITDSNAGTTNVVLALNSSGNLTIGGSATPTFSATGGRFKLSGTTLLLATEASSNGDVDIVPNGLGKLDIQKPIINDTATGNLIGGAVEIDDKVAILATESAVAAFVINNNTTGGDIFTASSSGTARFTIANLGGITASGAISGLTGLTSSGTITFSGFSSNGGPLYANGSGVLAQITAGASTQCLLGGTTPTFGSCEASGIDAFWNQSSGALFPNNLTVDLAIGGQATSSALFAVTGIADGTPTATISASTNNNGISLIGSTATIQSLRMNTLTIGGSTTGNIVIDSGSDSVTLSDKLTLSSNITESNTGQYLCVNTTTFEVGRNNTSCSLSSARFKENINDLSYGLSDVMNLRPVTFNFKSEMNMGSDRAIGFIAEEVEKIVPELVSYDREGKPSGVNYPNMTALLARAVQELNAKLESSTIAGQFLRDYISSVVNEVVSNKLQVINPLASVDKIHTNVISPLAQDSEIAITLDDSKINIRESSVSDSVVVASIDNQGNATFSGTLSSKDASVSGELATENLTANSVYTESLEARSATVSGTLYADKIIANNIEYPESSESANINLADILNTEYSILNTDFVDMQNLSADFATFRGGLMSLGPATLTQVTVLDSLSIGTTFLVGSNSIDTLGQTLEIQPLRQGAISFMAGVIIIETDGTLRVTGNAEFASDVEIRGKLSANIISPVSDTIIIASGAEQSQEIASGSANFRDDNLLDIQGSASVSGALTSRKINLSFAEQAFATSDIEAVATGSAGTAVLRQYRKELTIKNPNVTGESLIYITPVGNTNNKVLYLLRQTSEDQNIGGIEGSFTVGVNTASTVNDIKFNWIIVN